MSQRKKILYGLFGIIIGLCIGALLRNYRTLEIVSMCNSINNIKQKSSLEIIGLHPSETPSNSQNNLVFVGVMTAKDFLKGRATAVYETWGKNIPGRIAFFSSEDSTSEDLPLVALKGVDDRYPPQKKSFMMLHYMYEHFIDKFEWFARADDDVFIRTDKLEKFLRSIDSSKPQFIGQAGRGNSEEFGLLSLEFDENFCMGGPGVILSRETLRRVAPHIPTCLKNLYSTHEDVEVGRCVQKFAGIPCTWNYEMQAILHHNSSGSRAFSGNLKNKEVHSAITLHPVKKPPLMYRLHAYNLGLQAQELRQESLFLHRDIAQMISLLQIPKINKNLAPGVPIFPHEEASSNYLGDHSILGINPDLNRHKPVNTGDVIEWDFIAKSMYSGIQPNPKRKIESSVKEGINDVIREIMEHINNFSRQRGRVIEFRELLYGYLRVNTLYGQDLILDLLLVYKKYRGKKMTVPVRRHLYVQRSFTDVRIREITDSNSFGSGQINRNLDRNRYSLEMRQTAKISDKMKHILNTGLEKLSDTFAITSFDYRRQQEINVDRIVLVLPLAGRYDTFLRFLRNFEEIALKIDKNTDLLVSLFIDQHESSLIINYLENLQQNYPLSRIKYLELYGNFSRGIALDKAIRSKYCNDNDILFFIDVDILFTKESLDRIRNNVVRGEQVYLPIVFSEYSPQIDYENSVGFTTENANIKLARNFTFYSITNKSGYFRQFGYGLVGVYKTDVINSDIEGFNTDINGWGLEDVKFLEKIIAANNKDTQKLFNIIDDKIDMSNPNKIPQEFAIFRAPDPSLVHVYHPIYCDKNLDDAQLKMCLGTKANTLGNYNLLENKFLSNKSLLKYVRSKGSV